MRKQPPELDRLKPMLAEEAEKRNENTCVFYDHATCRTSFRNYEKACKLEKEDRGYIVLVSFIHNYSTDDRVNEIMRNCVEAEEDPTDDEIDEMVEWVIQVKEEYRGRKI